MMILSPQMLPSAVCSHLCEYGVHGGDLVALVYINLALDVEPQLGAWV